MIEVVPSAVQGVHPCGRGRDLLVRMLYSHGTDSRSVFTSISKTRQHPLQGLWNRGDLCLLRHILYHDAIGSGDFASVLGFSGHAAGLLVVSRSFRDGCAPTSPVFEESARRSGGFF